jgi:two-component system, NtrC family, sensor kinase
MTDTEAAQVDGQARRGVAGALPIRWSLRTRLALLLGLAITLVVGVATYLQSRMFERTVEQELTEEARLAARAVAADLETLDGPFTPADLTGNLRDLAESLPELASITIVTLYAGKPMVYVSTATAPSAAAVAAGQQAIERQEPVWSRNGTPLRVLAVPLARDDKPFGAISVTVPFDALFRLRKTGRVIAAWSTLIAVVSLFVLIELLTRWFIHRPIGAIRKTVGEVASGSLSARAPVLRQDEIGAVATGLNHMLDELEGLHGTLQSKVAQATAELRQRNRELLDMYQQMFQLREELGRSQQLAAVGEATSAVAHQIGTPLNLVSGHIQLLLEQQEPGSPVAQRLRVAEDQLRKIASIVQGLLARSRRSLEREPVDLSHVIRRLCTLVQPALESAGVTLTFEGGPVRKVSGDVAELELTLLNFVSNALDAMHGGGSLTIRVKDDGDHVRIEVADTGTGIPPEIRDRIFEPWFTTKEAGRGTGLGLSIARSVVEGHGGRIDVASAPGRGTTLTVVLPAIRTPAAEELTYA